LRNEIVGWDIGGAHLKACLLEDGEVVAVAQQASPLWLGLEHFHRAANAILESLQPGAECVHAVTMTGELADVFASREDGVAALAAALGEHVGSQRMCLFAGHQGFMAATDLRVEHTEAVASANWLATALYAASRVRDAILVDIGSTTTDVILLQNAQVNVRGYTDCERMRYDELVYCGVVRTPLMSLGQCAPLDGGWVGLMAELFATTADVYRLSGELPEAADQMTAADGGAKTAAASARRIARMVGLDAESRDGAVWRGLARYFRELQLQRVGLACERQLSRGLTPPQAPFVGAGIGRFLVQELARRFSHPYQNIDDLYPVRDRSPSGFNVADCAPAAAVACLARQWPCIK